jgi:hypothetical protein
VYHSRVWRTSGDYIKVFNLDLSHMPFKNMLPIISVSSQIQLRESSLGTTHQHPNRPLNKQWLIIKISINSLHYPKCKQSTISSDHMA